LIENVKQPSQIRPKWSPVFETVAKIYQDAKVKTTAKSSPICALAPNLADWQTYSSLSGAGLGL